MSLDFSVDKETGSSELALQTATVSISEHGEMGWLKKLTTTSTCKMNFDEFPFDEQVCVLEFVSWSYDNSSIFLVPIPRNNVIRQDDIWNVTKIEASTVYEDADCCSHPFPYIIIKVHIKRRPAPLTLGLVIPSSLLSILVLISFVLPADSGERISLSITLLLTVTLFQQLTSSMIPRSQIPKLSKYFFVLLIILMLALIANALVINLHFENGRKKPKIVQKVVLSALGYLSCIYKEEEDIEEGEKLSGPVKNLALELNENDPEFNQGDAKSEPTVFTRYE